MCTHGKMQTLLCPKCDRLFSNLVTLCAPLSFDYFSYLLYENTQLLFIYFFSKLYNRHCNVCCYRASPLLPQGQKAQEKQQSDSWVCKQILFSTVLRSFTIIPYLVCEDNVVGVQMDFCLLMDGLESVWY